MAHCCHLPEGCRKVMARGGLNDNDSLGSRLPTSFFMVNGSVGGETRNRTKTGVAM